MCVWSPGQRLPKPFKRSQFVQKTISFFTAAPGSPGRVSPYAHISTCTLCHRPEDRKRSKLGNAYRRLLAGWQITTSPPALSTDSHIRKAASPSTFSLTSHARLPSPSGRAALRVDSVEALPKALIVPAGLDTKT